MTSRTTERFRKAFDTLPESIKDAARKNYSLWKDNPFHKSLKYKKISQAKDIYSVRISKGWRALGVRKEDYIIWFWIGSHSEYDQLIKNL